MTPWLDIIDWQCDYAARDPGADYDEDDDWCPHCALYRILHWQNEQQIGRKVGPAEITLGDWRVRAGMLGRLWVIHDRDTDRDFVTHRTPAPRSERDLLAGRARVLDLGPGIERIKPGFWVRDLFAIDTAISSSGFVSPPAPLGA
jgi:hypothetical protein